MFQAKFALRTELPRIKWTYLPREGNATADSLAGQASALVADARLNGCEPDNSPFLGAIPSAIGQKNDFPWEHTITCLLTGAAPSFMLPEKPCLKQRGSVALAKAIYPGKGQGLIALYAHAEHRHHSQAFVCRYQPAVVPALGRSYADGPLGEKYPK